MFRDVLRRNRRTSVFDPTLEPLIHVPSGILADERSNQSHTCIHVGVAPALSDDEANGARSSQRPTTKTPSNRASADLVPAFHFAFHPRTGVHNSQRGQRSGRHSHVL